MNNDLKEALEGFSCLMCENKDYGWYEVLRDNCGKPHDETLETLCDNHKIIFIKQLKEEMKK